MPKPSSRHYDPPIPVNADGEHEIEFHKKYATEYDHVAYQVCRKSGYTLGDLGEAFGVDIRTILSWMEKYPSFKAAILAGRDEYDTDTIERALVKKAGGYAYDEIRIEDVFVKQDDGTGKMEQVPGQKVTKITKHQPPDPIAIKFWLLNRSKKRWKPERAIAGGNDGPDEDHQKIVKEIEIDKMTSEELLAMAEFIEQRKLNGAKQQD